MAKADIHIGGARENNLKGVDLTIPKQTITIFTGVSGSGISSIVFGTIAAEAQRRLCARQTPGATQRVIRRAPRSVASHFLLRRPV